MGIVSLGSRVRTDEKPAKAQASRKSTEKKTPSVASKTGAKSRKKTGSVMVVDNPVARGGERTVRPRKSPPSAKSMASGKGRRPSSAARRYQDDFFRESSAAGKSGRRSASGHRQAPKRKRNPMSGLDIFLLSGIVCMLALMLWQGTQYANFRVMQQAVSRQSYYPGTTIEGVDVSGMTYEAAMEYWESQIEPRYANRTVTLDSGETITAAELGYTSDYATVLSNAWSAGRSGSLEERYQAIASRVETPVAYTVTRTPYREDLVAAYASQMAQKVDTEATEAKIQSFDTKTYKFVFTEPQPGQKLDQTALQNSIMQALDAGGGTVSCVIETIEPTTTVESVAENYGMITQARTNASSSSSNRLNNIRLALQLINGTCLKPGETFSFNEVVGERTKARGFKEATAYSSGEVTEQVGGGICQVSTTLFNAAVKADLEIVERHNHSLTVSYVEKGKDAAVNWGSQDLRFKNNTDDDIYICCYLTDDKRVRFGIFGKLLPNGETITVEGVATGEIDYETEYQASGLLASGEQVVLQKGKKGSTAEAYKLRWDANGKLISRELLCKSRYKAVKEIIQYGP